MKLSNNIRTNRFNNVIKNTYIAIVSQVIVIILGFISRAVLIHTIGVEYAGISGLFTNILSILSLVELGLGSSMIFTYYGPIAEKNYDKLSALVNYYKKLYRIIMTVIIILGLLITPFVEWFIKLDTTIDNIHIFFILYVINTAVSYMCVFRTDILVANEKRYIITGVNLISRILRVLVQILLLMVFRSFLGYLVVEIIFNIVSNVICDYIAKRLYPYVKNSSVQLKDSEKKDILDTFKSRAIYKMAVVMINSTDNILISKIVGTLYVGLYSNYCMISTALTNVLVLLNNSVVASVGNLIPSKDNKKKQKVMDVSIVAFIWLGIYVSTMYYIFANPFIQLWLGKDTLLSNAIVGIITLYIYITFVYNSVTIYREAAGLFRKTKYITVVEAILNIVLSIILGKIYGIAGILGATIVSKACTRLWFEPYLIYKDVLQIKSIKFVKYNIIGVILTIISIILCKVVDNGIAGVTWSILIVKMIICTVIINGLIYVMAHPLEEYKYIENKVKNKLRKGKN